MLFFFKQKTAYEMRISDWSSDVCSSDRLGTSRLETALLHQLDHPLGNVAAHGVVDPAPGQDHVRVVADLLRLVGQVVGVHADAVAADQAGAERQEVQLGSGRFKRSEEQSSELQSLMRISYDVFCLKKK